MKKRARALDSPPLGNGGLGGVYEPSPQSEELSYLDDCGVCNLSEYRQVASDPPCPPCQGGEKNEAGFLAAGLRLLMFTIIKPRGDCTNRRFLRPYRGGLVDVRVHGFRSASPVATFRGPIRGR